MTGDLGYIAEALRPLAVPVGELHEDPTNARKGHAVDRIAASLKTYGQRKPVVANRAQNGKIEAGNGTYRAAKSLGWSHIAVVWVEDDAATAAGYGIADNRLGDLSEWDTDVLADVVGSLEDMFTGFTVAELDELLPDRKPALEDPGPQVDKAEELRVKWGVEPGQLWQLGEHRLVCGDCTDAAVVARVMGGETLGGLITDPPYSSGGFTRGDRQGSTGDKYQFKQDGVQVRYEDFAGDNKDQRSWITWCHLWLSTWLRYARQGAVFALFIDWRQLPALTDAVQSAGWLWRGVAVWDKTEAARPLYGRFKPQCEFVVWGSAGPLPINDGTPTYPGVCRAPVVLQDKQHLTQKPVEVGEWSMSMTKLGEVVVDPFLGSGTTLIACERLGRRCRAVEISPGYVAVALERWSVMTGRTPEVVL